MNFQTKLNKIITKNNSLVCVGLDTDINKIPKHISQNKFPVFEFNKSIIDKTYDLVCAYKPNSAFYEALGDRGLFELKMTCDYINQKHPEIPIILDAKRADIGNTNNGYIAYAYEYLNVDAITLNPYLGKEALDPFLKIENKGAIILCKTSNKGAEEFQDLKINNTPLHQYIAKKVINEWNTNKNCLLVVGATYPEELKTIRQISKDIILLIPGIGAQGGDLKKTLKYGLNPDKSGLIINSSRGIIYVSEGKDFAEKARLAAQSLRDEINKYRK